MSDSNDSARAIFRALALTSFVDGQADHAEAKLVEKLVELDPRFAKLDDSFELAVSARVLLDQKGVDDALVEIVAPIVEADRAHAFRLCVRVAGADGVTEGDEALVLGTLQELFGFDNQQVKSIVDEEHARRSKETS